MAEIVYGLWGLFNASLYKLENKRMRAHIHTITRDKETVTLP